MTREQLVERIKDCGKYIQDNADEMLISFENTISVRISLEVGNDILPTITVLNELSPRSFYENRYFVKKERG